MKVQESIIKVKKTKLLEEYRLKASQELKLLKHYKFWRFSLVVIACFMLTYWFMNTFYFDIKQNWTILVPLYIVCVLMSAGIDNLLCYYYNGIVIKRNLDIINFESGSYKKFVTELKSIIKDEMERQGQEKYSIYDMTVMKDEYSCRILVWSEK